MMETETKFWQGEARSKNRGVLPKRQNLDNVIFLAFYEDTHSERWKPEMDFRERFAKMPRKTPLKSCFQAPPLSIK
ncbi:hypothetical protein WA1_05110 [Scytonema hofmannii PCC 7110]|uniref:Uncharacterized protein n=1 Tax=Scytonema hofmannii PCC 7110 TaxID=128403 RepID=A0A139WZR5_9CYAN|nr:hypothetical protein WA1_05110 [Scytonema hofmannii PCC 7110]